MRVTQNTTANQIMNNLQVIRSRQDKLEQQASSGVKISAPGDDPTTAQQVLQLKSFAASSTQFARNITNATATLSMSDSTLSEIGDSLVRAKELALSMANETNSNDSRNAALKEIEQLKAHVTSLGNTQFNGKYIFGGFKNDTPPLDPAGNFIGTNDAISIEVSQDAYIDVNYPGGSLFQGATPPASDMLKIFDRLVGAITTADTPGVRAELATLDEAAGRVLTARSVLGASANRLTNASSLNEDMQLTTSKVLADLQDVDYIQVISDLSKQQTAFETALAASAKISQVSLLDYLR